MSVAKTAITIDEELIKKIDLLVEKKVFPNRSEAIQKAVEEKLVRFDQDRLLLECSKLDPEIEQKSAEEEMSLEVQEWPLY